MSNQHNTSKPRRQRAPAFAVTEEERLLLYAYHRHYRVPFASIYRLGFVAAGILPKDSLDEDQVPTELYQAGMDGRVMATLPPSKLPRAYQARGQASTGETPDPPKIPPPFPRVR